jgi:hypothetical protein
MSFTLTCNALLPFSQLFAADALQNMALSLITYGRKATAFKLVRDEAFPGANCGVEMFKLPHILRAKISPHLPNILSDVTSIQDSRSDCKDKKFRNVLIIQIYCNINMEDFCILCVCTKRPLFSLSFFATAQPGPGPPHSQGFWITHNYAPQSVGLLWTNDQSVAETST